MYDIIIVMKVAKNRLCKPKKKMITKATLTCVK